MSINSSSCLEEYNALTADKAGQHLLLWTGVGMTTTDTQPQLAKQ